MNKIVFSIFLLLTPIITIAQNPIITKFENVKFYKFVNVNSKHYLGAANYEQVEGNDFRQFEDGGQANIQWRIENQPNNNFIIKSTDEKSCLAIDGDELNQIVSLVNFNAANGQKWVFEPQANGQVKIKNVLTNKYIGVPDGSFAENAKVALSENTVENLLLWQIQEVLPIDHKVAVATGNYLFKNVNSNGFIFPTENAIEGSELLQSKEKTAINIFKLEQQKDGTYLIISNENNYCFDAENTNSSPVLSKPSNNKSLYWILTPKGKNTYNIKSIHNGQILSVKDGLRTDKAALTLTSIKNENANYTQWIISNSDGTAIVTNNTAPEPIVTTPPIDKIINGTYIIRPDNDLRKFLRTEQNNNGFANVSSYLIANTDTFNNKFIIKTSTYGISTILSQYSNLNINYLDNPSNSPNLRCSNESSENGFNTKWKIISLNNNKYKIQSLRDTAFYVGSKNNNNILCIIKNEEAIEKNYNIIWVFEQVADSFIKPNPIATTPPLVNNINDKIKDGIYTINPHNSPNDFLTNDEERLSHLVIKPKKDNNSTSTLNQRFIIQSTFNGITTIASSVNKNKKLIYHNNTGGKASLDEWDERDSLRTKLKLVPVENNKYTIQKADEPLKFFMLYKDDLMIREIPINEEYNHTWILNFLDTILKPDVSVATPPIENNKINNMLENGVYFFSPEKQPNMFLTYYSTYPETFTFRGKVERNNATKNQALEIKNFSNEFLMISKPDDITKSLSYENFDVKASLRLLNFFIDTANVNALWSLIPLGENKFKIKSVREPEKYLTYHGENNTLFEVTNNPSYNQIWIIKSTVNNAINNNQTLPTALIGLNGKYQITSKTSNKKLALIKNGNTNKLGTTNIINTGITTKIDIATTNEIGTLSALNLFINVKKNANQLPTNINLGSTLENWKFIKIENNKYKIESINNPGYFLTEEISTGTGLIVSMKATTDKKYCQIWNVSKL